MSIRLPLWRHILFWMLVLTVSLTSPIWNASGPVQGSTGPTIEQPENVSAAACKPHAWRSRSATAGFYSGFAGQPYAYVYWTVKYNGCDVVKAYEPRCEFVTTIIAAVKDWCGFYQNPAWGRDKIEVGANWNNYSSPVPYVGASWGAWFRVTINNKGQVVGCRPAPPGIHGWCRGA